MKLIIPVIPTAKGRPRLSTRGGFAHAYTPAKTRHAEEEFAREVRRLYRGEPIAVPIAVIVVFFMPIPASESKRHKEFLECTPHSKRPDKDNLMKLVKDACNGILWKDDALIYQTLETKVYSKVPRVEIEVLYEPIAPLPAKSS